MPNTAWVSRKIGRDTSRATRPRADRIPDHRAPAPALDTSSSTDVPAEDGLDYGRGDNAQEGDEMSRVYETRADREANAGLAEGSRAPARTPSTDPKGGGAPHPIHGHENGGQVEERAIGAVDHNGNKKWGR